MLSTTAITHLLFLALVATYLAASYPGGGWAAALQLGVALASELLHALWPTAHRLVVVRECLFLAGLGGAWLVGTPLYPLVGMALCGSLLLLVRHRALRFLPALCAADLVWCAVRGGQHSAPDAALVLVPLAIAALAADAWLAGQSNARTWTRRPGRGLPRWGWLAGPVLVCAAIGLLLGLPAAQRAPADLPVEMPRQPANPVRRPAGSGLPDLLRIGDQVRIERDQAVAARLEWNGAPPIRPRMIYLRAMALPQVIPEGAFVLWRAAGEGFTPFHARFPPRAPSAWLLRKKGGGDTVLHPDGCAGVALDRLQRDSDGNWYRAGLGREAVIYRVSVEHLTDPELDEATAGETGMARRFPRELTVLPWEDIEQPSWPAMAPEDAARDIVAELRERCRYDLEDLPEPDPSPGGAIRTFLFDPSPGQRRGHCQYFATAAVLLLRHSGHAARTVLGFASEEVDDRGVTFRGLHAHAWLEVVNSRGRWQRFDATPPAGMLQRVANLDPERNEAPPQVSGDRPAGGPRRIDEDGEGETVVPGLHLPLRTIAVLAAGAGGLLLVGWAVLRWRARPGPQERHRERLAQANAGLFGCARELGVAVGPATTLADVAAALTRRTGIDLAAHLQEHQAARYGGGPAPRPWPLARLRAAVRR